MQLVSLQEALYRCSAESSLRFNAETALEPTPAQTGLYCFSDGSFMPHGNEGSPAIGWACAFFLVDGAACKAVEACVGVASGTYPDWIGSHDQPSAFMAECLALAYGAWISARNFPDIDVLFLSDCEAAIGVAVAKTKYDARGVAGTTRGLHLLRSASSGGKLAYKYVPGHQGIFGNELVDQIAKAACQGTCLGDASLTEASRWLQDGGPYLPWFAAACRAMRGAPEWPVIDGTSLHLEQPVQTPEELLRPFLPAVDMQVKGAEPPPDLAKPTLARALVLNYLLGEQGPPHDPATANRHVSGRTCRDGPAASADANATWTQPRDRDASPCLQLKLKIASYNALSLAAPSSQQKSQLQTEGLAFRTARPALLARSLAACNVDVAAVQETRCAAGTLFSGDYYRVCSGSEGSQYGTEWWFRMGRPILRSPDCNVCIRPNQIVVHHATPRRLLVSFEPGRTKLYLLSYHAPHRGSEAHCIVKWWEDTIRLCNEVVRDNDCILAGDANAAVGSVVSHCVGDLAAEEEDLSGFYLHRLLQERAAWAPSTFWHVHTGQNWTYRQKRNGRLIRPDLIALPNSWWWGSVKSAIAVEVHAGQVAPDHFAVTATVEVLLASHRRRACPRAAMPRRFDEAAMSQPEHRGKILEIIQSLPEVPWHVSAHDHAAYFTDHLQKSLQLYFPLQGHRARRQHSFLTDDTWELHSTVARLRRFCAQCKLQVARHTRAAAFLAWKGGPQGPSFADLTFTPWWRRTSIAYARFVHQLDTAGRALRRACSADRAAYLTACARQIDKGMSQEGARAVRRLLGHKRRKPFAPDVLPALLNKQGQMCATPEAIADRWKEHFSELEAGVDADPAAVLDACDVARATAWPLPEHVLDLPSENALARVIASAPLHKATGVDGISASVGRCHPAALAERLFPLLLKMCLCGQEPVGFKGGALIHIYKGRGSHSSCSSHRGIMLLSTLSKYIHRALRPCISTHFLRTSLPLHLGGKPGVPVTFASHIVSS